MDDVTSEASRILATDVETLLRSALAAINNGAKTRKFTAPNNQNWTIYGYGNISLLAVGEVRSKMEGDKLHAERDVVKLWYFE